MNLYNIDSRVLNILEQDEDFTKFDKCKSIFILKQLNALDIAEEYKVENIVLFIKNLNSEIDALKAEEDTLKARREEKEHIIKVLKNYLEACMLHNNYSKLETPRYGICLKNSQCVNIVDGIRFFEYARISNKYLLNKTTEIDEETIINDLKNGEEIPGVELIQKHKLLIK